MQDQLERVLDELVQLRAGARRPPRIRARRDRGRGSRQDLRGRHRGGARRDASASRPVSATGCWARTARASRRPSACSARSCARRPGARVVAGFDVVAQPREVAPSHRLRDAGGRRRRVRDGARAARPAGAPARAPARRGGPPGAQLLLEVVDLADVADKRLGGFSGGMQRRVDLAAVADAPARRRVPGRADRGPRPARSRGDLGRAATGCERTSASRSS